MVDIAPLLEALHLYRDNVHVLAGRWRNQLDSELVLDVDDEGLLRGSFRTATGGGEQLRHTLAGTCDPTPGERRRVLAFAVSWPDARTATAWCGNYLADDDTIRASWLMTTDMGVQDDWRSTVVGHDVFRRQ